MPEPIVVLNVPLKPFLKKYLTHKFGDSHRVSRTSFLGSYLIDLLDKKYRKSNVTMGKEHSYPLEVPHSVVHRVGFDISPVKLKHLAEMIYKVFLNDMYSYIDVSIGNELVVINKQHDSINKQNIVKAISQFLKFFDIKEDEISSDTLYRSYNRSLKTDKVSKS